MLEASPRLDPRWEMAEPAISRMTLAEFLRWEDGTDTRWQLIDGVPVATAPPAVAYGIPL